MITAWLKEQEEGEGEEKEEDNDKDERWWWRERRKEEEEESEDGEFKEGINTKSLCVCVVPLSWFWLSMITNLASDMFLFLPTLLYVAIYFNAIGKPAK